MKHLRKIMALAIVAVMIMGMSVMASAATITINQNNEDGAAGAETYSLYKIFDVTKTSAQSNWVTTDTNIVDQYEKANAYEADTTYYTRTGAGTEESPYVYSVKSGIDSAESFAEAGDLYKISLAEGFAYTITDTAATDEWFDVLGSVNDSGVWTPASGQNWVTLSESTTEGLYNVTWVGGLTEADAKAFAAWLYSHKGNILGDQEIISNGEAATTTTVDDGYYLISSSLGTNLVLATSDITINTKNQYVTDEKTTETASVTVGENATYYIRINLPATIDTTKDVTVHDVLDSHLSFNKDSVTVYKNSTSGLETALAGDDGEADTEDDLEYKDLTINTQLGSDYTLNVAADEDEMADTNCTFEIVIPKEQVAALMNEYKNADNTFNGVTVIFKYTAELLSTAAADTNYTNTEYSTYSKYKTEESAVNVQTYDFNFTKTDGTSRLEGAVFNLYPNVRTYYTTVAKTTEADAGVVTEYYTDTQGNAAIDFIGNTYYTTDKYTTAADEGTTTSYYGAATTAKKADTDDVEDRTKTLTKNLVGGALNVSGLGAGTYYLVETIAPAGYNKLENPIVIVIEDDGTFTISEGADTLYEKDTDNDIDGKSPNFNVVNNSGSVLPSTGGIGTTIFYVIGAVLVIGAGVLLVTRRRMRAE